MTKTPTQALSTSLGQALRALAEEKAALLPEPPDSSSEEARQALHELRVHQIELELQNEELRRTQGELEASRARYFDSSAEQNANGATVCRATFCDITDRRQTDEARQRALNLLMNIADRVPGVVYQFQFCPDGSSCIPFASDAIR